MDIPNIDINEGKIATDFLTSVIKESYKGIKGWALGKSKEKDFFGKQARKYAENLIENYNFIRVLGMSEPVPLLSLYIRVDVLEEVTAYKHIELEKLQKDFDLVNRNFGKKRESKGAIQLVNDTQKFILLGKPGAGKTTFLKFLAIASLSKDVTLENRRIPVFIGLKEYSEKGMILLDYIAHQFDICGLPDAESFIEQLLSNGKCILLLDGLDEVSQSNLDRVVGEIKDISKKYGDNQFVISCRVAAYNHYFPQFTDVEVADFDDFQIERFISRWFEQDKETGIECWKQIKDSSSLKEMAKLPILLTLLCIEFDEEYGFPTSRSELYESAINVLLKKWDSSRRIKRDSVYEELSVKKKASMLSSIAYQNFTEEKYFFKEKDISNQLEDYLENLNFIENEVDGNVVLKEIAAQHGILSPRAKRIYSFTHLSFQEYFTANYIATRNSELINQVVEQYSLTDNWRQVFLLITEMLPSADYLMDCFNQKIYYLYESSPNLKKLVESFNTLLLDTESKYPDNMRRIYALYLFSILASSRVKERIRISDHESSSERARISALYLLSSRTRALALAHPNAFDLSHPNALDLTHANTFDINLSLASNLVNDFTHVYNLDFDSIINIGKILGLYLLMVDCMNTNCSLSPIKRKEILENILLIED